MRSWILYSFPTGSYLSLFHAKQANKHQRRSFCVFKVLVDTDRNTVSVRHLTDDQ